ncbi:MAG: hypothetical protein MI785_14895 [Kiloniellales bacterium]|nr:hypothetical protein [Kiloniellales bacterium]
MSETQTRDISETDGAAAEAPQPEWAVVEIMGHRRHAGLCEEVQRFGSTMLRIDVYRTGDAAPVQTFFYGGSAIFSYSLCTESDARRIADSAFSLRPPAVRRLGYDGDDDDDY